MPSGREHLASNHQKEHDHWSTFGKGLGNVATHLRAMHKETGMTGECKPADEVDKLAALAQSHATYHGSQVEECMKAADPADLAKRDQLEPTPVSGVVPDRPDHLRMIARPGQRPVPEEAQVPREFEKLVS